MPEADETGYSHKVWAICAMLRRNAKKGGAEMTEVLTSAQMRAIEQQAIASGAVTGLELMERAGAGVVAAILTEWPELSEGHHRAMVLCGPGNNGGDGFVVARLLKARGWDVRAWLFGTPEGLPPDAAANLAEWRRLGRVEALSVPVPDETWRQMADWAQQDKSAPLLLVDALFGIGLRRPLRTEDRDDLAMLFVDLDDLWLEGGPALRRVSVDVPSGLCADSGRILLPDDPSDPSLQTEAEADPRFFCFEADLTVTFHSPKPGHLLAMGPRVCGRLCVVDIGLATHAKARLSVLDAPSRRAVAKHPGNKFTHGHALILSGGAGRGGAARLAARGALRIGAGLVTVACPPDALPENAARLDAVMLRALADAAALADMLSDQRINALCLGPGMGTGEREAGMLAAALGCPVPGRAQQPAPGVASHPAGGAASDPRRIVVLDADALTLLSRHPDLFASLHRRCILTPHGGEFARLFPDLAERLGAPPTTGPAFSKIEAALLAAARAGCVVLFKGPDTVIASPDGRCAIHAAAYDRSAPWLATAGSGDVLAGFITGLVARGLDPFDAACTAAWLHVECARNFGPGLIAEDLPDQLPAVFRALKA